MLTTIKVVINSDYGGFSLSDEAVAVLPGIESTHALSASKKDRTNPDLIALIEDWGPERVGGWAADLKIVEIPADVSWHIEEYDGSEYVAEDHRTWS